MDTRPSIGAAPHVVLVGAGHGHLHVVAHAARLHRAGIRVTLVAPRDFRYSGLISPVAAGVLPSDTGRIDVAALARRSGVVHLDTTVAGIDLPRRRLRLADGSGIGYSAVSFNIGSVSSAFEVAVGDGVVVTKPLTSLARLPGRLEELEARRARDGRPVRVGIVGSGATAVELAANLTARLGTASQIVIHGRAARPLEGTGFPLAARQRAVRRLCERGVRLVTGIEVTAVDGDRVHLGGRGASGPFDLTVLATGLVAPPLVAELGLGDARGIPVTASLQHPRHPEVFAVGDCSHFLPRPLPMLGVFGVRAAPVLLDGLRAYVCGEPPREYHPQPLALQVLELGRGRGLAVRGRWWSEGRGALLLKRAIDHRWLARYR